MRLCILGAALAVIAAAPRSNTPRFSDLVRRIGAYVSAYGEHASAFVATETYTQHVIGFPASEAPVDRTTIAEFAIVKTSGSQPWLGFRDIIEVDGNALTDRRDRLLALLTSPSPDVDQARQLSEESARLNIGPVARNFNVPTTVLFFFTPGNLDRFSFTRAREDTGDLIDVAFHEKDTPTLIRTPDGGPVRGDGELLVDAHGVVHETILRLHPYSRQLHGEIATIIDVVYRRPSNIEAWLPSVMTEEYVATHATGEPRVEARAEYSNYRQFETSARIR